MHAFIRLVICIIHSFVHLQNMRKRSGATGLHAASPVVMATRRGFVHAATHALQPSHGRVTSSVAQVNLLSSLEILAHSKTFPKMHSILL